MEKLKRRNTVRTIIMVIIERMSRLAIRENSKLALTMKWAATRYSNEVGWTIDGRYASEDEVINLISEAFKQFDTKTVKKAVAYCKANWKLDISQKQRFDMHKKVIEYEAALENNGDVTSFIADEMPDDAPLYCLLGELYDNKSDIQFANYWYQKSALLGYPEGEGRLGLSYHRGYGMTADDLDDEHIEIALHMRSDKQALFWLKKALNDGWEDAPRYIEEINEYVAEREQRENRTLDEMIEEAKDGWGPQQLELADAYERGNEEKSIPVDYEKAVYWYNQSLYGIVHEYSVCLLIADILENKINDNKRALKYYRKAYIMDNYIVPDDERKKLSDKIKTMTKELFPDREEKIDALKDMLNAEQLSDTDTKALAEIMGYIQESIYLERTDEKEQDILLKRIPKAKAIVNAAFSGRAVAENALGVFYETGVILPTDYEKAEYWYMCAYTDGYDTAYENLATLLFDRRKKDEWVNFIILAARDGIEDAKKKCAGSEIDCMKTGPIENKSLDLYPVDSLFYKDATEEQIELIEQFFLIDDIQHKKNIMFRLVPSTTEEYMDAFINGQPYSSDSIIDKLMDVDDCSIRRKIVAEAGIDVSDAVLQGIPYLPLNAKEQRCIFKYGYKEHKRSPFRSYSFSQKWNTLTDKEKTVIKIMDADHHLTFDVANIIVDEYEKRFIADNEKHTQAKDGTDIKYDEEHRFWLNFGNDSKYMKRQAYADLKLADKEITNNNLRQAGANRFLNLLNMELNPILHPLVSMAATLTYECMVERCKGK